MKRALAVLVLCSVAAFAQFPAFTGKWDATLCLIGPNTPSLTSTLSLTTNISGIDITTAMGFGTGGLTSFKVSYKGAFGPFNLSGNLWFDPAAPAWMGSDLDTSLDFAGIRLGLTIRHWDKDYASYFYSDPWVWYPDEEPCQTYEDQAGMMYILSAKVVPISLKARFLDCSTGIEFYDLTIDVTGIGLCCGIALDASLAFSKEDGFKYLELTGIEIPLCCGVSLTAKITFTVDAKTVETGLKFAGFGDACFTVYGDALKEGDAWKGIVIYGWKIKCTLGDCNYVEFVTALNPTEVNKKLPKADRFLGAPCSEFEYIKLGFCGPGCCGGQYKVDLGIYFGTGGGLFDITRLNYSVKIPIMANFTLNISGRVAASNCTSSTLCLGWTFTF